MARGQNLTPGIRKLMRDEIEMDRSASGLYEDHLRPIQDARVRWLDLLLEAADMHTGEWLHDQLQSQYLYRTASRGRRSAGRDEFNRYYMRAVCGQASLGQVRTVRYEDRQHQSSEEGDLYDADGLLDYLREHPSLRHGDDYGRLGSANSGMTVEPA